MTTANRTPIAIVDDDESLCKAMGRLLRAAGYESQPFLSAEAFLGYQFSEEPACLMLDIQLGGGMSGFDLQRQLAIDGRNVPIIFITARDEADSRAEALRSGCSDYLRKTDSGQAVLAAIRAAVKAPAHDQTVC